MEFTEKDLIIKNTKEEPAMEIEVLGKEDQLSTEITDMVVPLTYYGSGERYKELKIAYVSDMHLEYHLKYYSSAIQMIRSIARTLYKSRQGANLLIFSGDISSDPKLVVMFFNHLVKEYRYDEFCRARDDQKQQKEEKKYREVEFKKAIRGLENIHKYIDKKQEQLKGIFDVRLFENYKTRYYAHSSC